MMQFTIGVDIEVKKSDITYVFSHNYTRIEIDSLYKKHELYIML